jgi:phage head maturation protease
MRTLEAIGSVRSVAPDSRDITGVVAPYNVRSNPTELLSGSGDIITEILMEGAARDSVAAWTSRTDGARMAYKPAHGEKPVGVVTDLADTPEAISFRASIFDTPAGDEYLANVRAGLNGVSPEFMPDMKTTKRMRDGTVVHRSIKLHALAGSNAPAYDGARIALRDMEDLMTDKETPAPEPPPTPEPEPEPAPPAARGAVPPISGAERAAAERATVSQYASSITITRPELVYGRDAEYNFMHDQWKISGRSLLDGKAEAGDRVRRHEAHLRDVAVAMERDAYSRIFDPGQAERAGDVLSSEIPGAYPNDYLPGLLTPRILKGRPMGSAYQRVPISDARPRVFPKVTTSGVAIVQPGEGNAAFGATDIATTAVTVNPLMYGAFTDVSRQALDGGDPSVLSIIFQDLVEAYSQTSEGAIKTAVEAGATASGVAALIATPYAGTLANVVNYFGVRFRPAEYAFFPPAIYTTLLAQADTTGRPLMPMLGAMNSQATIQEGGIAGNILGATAKLSWASTANTAVYGVPNDYVIFESSIAQFTYDQVVGPQAIRVGLWAYLAVGARLGSLKILMT